MREDVYNFLREYGFTKEEVYSFEEENEKMFFTNLVEVNKNIDFLTNKGLSKEEIMDVFRKDPYMITVKNNRLEMLDKVFIEELKIDCDSLKDMIVSNPDLYISSPVELNQNIDFLKEHNCTMEIIRKFVVNNPQIVSMSPDKFKGVVKFN